MVGEVDAGTAEGIHGLAEEHEDIRVHVVSREQAYRWVEEGAIDNAASVIALQWLALHHESLRVGQLMKQRYTPDFPEMMRLCETNFAQLRRFAAAQRRSGRNGDLSGERRRLSFDHR